MRTLYILIMLLAFSANGNAQFFKKLGKKAKEAAERVIERKAEEKVEKTVESTIDTVLNAPNTKKASKTEKKANSPEEKSTHTTAFPGTIFSGGNVTYEEKYIFPVTATIELEDATAQVKKMTMKQGYGEQAILTEMESGENPIIVDMKNEAAILLDINRGTAQIMSLTWMQKMMGNQSSEEELELKPTVAKTGNSKKMNGYMCYEYLITHNEGTINAWYAPKVPFHYQDYLRGMAKMFSKKTEENPSQLLSTEYGYVMEMIAYNKRNQKQTSMKVTALDEKVRMIAMSLFTIQKL